MLALDIKAGHSGAGDCLLHSLGQSGCPESFALASQTGQQVRELGI